MNATFRFYDSLKKVNYAFYEFVVLIDLFNTELCFYGSRRCSMNGNMQIDTSTMFDMCNESGKVLAKPIT